MINYRKCTIVPMISLTSGKVEFDLMVHGRTAHELRTIPHIIESIERRHQGFVVGAEEIRNLRPSNNSEFAEWLEQEALLRKYAEQQVAAVKRATIGAKRAPAFKGFEVKGIRDDDGTVRQLHNG